METDDVEEGSGEEEGTDEEGPTNEEEGSSSVGMGALRESSSDSVVTVSVVVTAGTTGFSRRETSENTCAVAVRKKAGTTKKEHSGCIVTECQSLERPLNHQADMGRKLLGNGLFR